jgi:hypothetical protein
MSGFPPSSAPQKTAGRFTLSPAGSTPDTHIRALVSYFVVHARPTNSLTTERKSLATSCPCIVHPPQLQPFRVEAVLEG